MSRGMGRIQRAILDDMVHSDGPQEVAWMARWLYRRIHDTEAPEPLPRSYMVSVRRAVCALEESGHICAGLAPRFIAPKNLATADMDLTKWLWLPDMQSPEGWCCPWPKKAVARVEAEEEATFTISVAPPVLPSLDEGTATPPPAKKPWGIQSEEEAHAMFADMVDGIYKVEPYASELRAMTSVNEITDKICEFFDIPPGHSQRQYVMIQVLRRTMDNVVDKTMDTMDNVG